MQCPECNNTFRSKQTLRHHFLLKHEEDNKYFCNQCEFKTLYTSTLRIHTESVHEKLKYSCMKCDYQTVYEPSLKHHIQSRHEGIRYPCKQCQLVSSSKRSLKKHIERKHNHMKKMHGTVTPDWKHLKKIINFKQNVKEMIDYNCPICKNKFSQHKDVILHIQSDHSETVQYI